MRQTSKFKTGCSSRRLHYTYRDLKEPSNFKRIVFFAEFTRRSQSIFKRLREGSQIFKGFQKFVAILRMMKTSYRFFCFQDKFSASERDDESETSLDHGDNVIDLRSLHPQAYDHHCKDWNLSICLE